mgnify:CR=1 FL=1
MKVTENCHLHKNYCLLKLTSDGNLPEMLPGQFVEVHVENSPTTFLRRPISVNYVDKSKNELWLLIQLVGDGTRKMAEFRPGDIVNIMLPLGNSFTIPSKEQENKRLLLIGAAGSNLTEEEAAEWKQMLVDAFPDSYVYYDPLSFSIGCHIGPKGYGMGISVCSEDYDN